MHPIQEYLQENLSKYLDLLHQMVSINSFTANAQGVNRLAELTAKAFAPLGFEAEFVQSANLDFGRHLFLTRPSPLKEEGPAALNSNPALALISHLDTVFSPEEEIQNDFNWRPEGDRIYGPGIVDIKGGTVMIYLILDALRTFAPQAYDSVAWLIGSCAIRTKWLAWAMC